MGVEESRRRRPAGPEGVQEKLAKIRNDRRKKKEERRKKKEGRKKK